jgi:hypothetical protein
MRKGKFGKQANVISFIRRFDGKAQTDAKASLGGKVSSHVNYLFVDASFCGIFHEVLP